MIVEKAILHILDSDNNALICTDQLLDLEDNSINKYITQVTKKSNLQDAKEGFLDPNNEILQLIKRAESEFVEVSKELCQKWQELIIAAIVPPADYVVTQFEEEGKHAIAIIRLLHKQQMMHNLDYNDAGLNNSLVVNKALVQSGTSKLAEAIVIGFDGSYRLIETKYEIEGEKTYYLGSKYLQVITPTHSVSEALAEVKEIVEEVAPSTQERYEVKAKLQEAVHKTLEQEGTLDVEYIGEELFHGDQHAKDKYQTAIQERQITTQPVKESQKMVKKYAVQKFKLDNGIEIAIPNDVYQNKDIVEFVTQKDGSLSVIIKNIDEIRNKF